MMRDWVAYARGKAPWSRFDTTHRPTMVYGVDSGIEHAPREPERAAVAATG
jgi:hypothetical protein